MNRHGVRVVSVRNFGAGILGKTKYLLILRIRHMYVYGHDTRHLNDLPGFLSSSNRRLRRRRIGAHQAAGTQQGAAKIARHHTAHVFESRTTKHLERRHAARTARLTVIALALAAIDQNPRGHIMTSIVMALANHLDKGVCLVLGLNMDQLSNKPTLAVDKLARSLNIRLQSKIAVQQSPSNTSKATNSLNNTAKAVSVVRVTKMPSGPISRVLS